MSDRFKQYDHDSKARLLRARTERFNVDVERLATSLREGKITIGMWEQEMRTQLRLFHTGCVAIGKGGWKHATSSDWGKVGNILKEQYKYLHNFARDIYAKRETITAKAIAWRAKLYGEKGGYTAAYIGAGDVAGFLPWIPKDGSTICLNKCLCEWLLSSTPDQEMQAVVATWTLNVAEHCATCVGRDGHTERFWVPPEVEVPSRIGGYGR